MRNFYFLVHTAESKQRVGFVFVKHNSFVQKTYHLATEEQDSLLKHLGKQLLPRAKGQESVSLLPLVLDVVDDKSVVKLPE